MSSPGKFKDLESPAAFRTMSKSVAIDEFIFEMNNSTGQNQVLNELIQELDAFDDQLTKSSKSQKSPLNKSESKINDLTSLK